VKPVPLTVSAAKFPMLARGPVNRVAVIEVIPIVRKAAVKVLMRSRMNCGVLSDRRAAYCHQQ
jgi:hypothetical protein